VLRVIVASLLAHRLRLIMTAVMIALGAGLVAGTFTLTDSVRGALSTSTAAASAPAVVVQPTGGADGKDGGAPTWVLAVAMEICSWSDDAEWDLRPAKTQQKISGRLRSETVTRHRYAIRGYISTATKHGISVFTALRDALTGNPRMPPIPASS
jgi:transposase